MSWPSLGYYVHSDHSFTSLETVIHKEVCPKCYLYPWICDPVWAVGDGISFRRTFIDGPFRFTGRTSLCVHLEIGVPCIHLRSSSTCKTYNSIIYISRHYVQGEGLNPTPFVILNTTVKTNNSNQFLKAQSFDFYPISFSHWCVKHERTGKGSFLLTN